MNDVLERNLQALLERAYHPVRPRAEFRTALLAELRSRQERPGAGEQNLAAQLKPGRSAASPRRWLPAVAIAAALLIAVPLLTLAALEFIRGTETGPANGLPGAIQGGAVAEGSGDEARGTSEDGQAGGDRSPLAAEHLDASGSGIAGLEATIDVATGVLVGRVVDAESGQPIPRFVFWRRLERDLPQTATPEGFEVEDEQGHFLFESVAPDRYALLVEAPGYAVWKVRGASVEAGNESRHEVRLVRGSAVHGHVLDAATGAPLAGARVFAEFDLPYQVMDFSGRDLEREPTASAFTDANGAYTLEHLSPGQHQLRVSHPDHATGWSTNFELPEREQERPLELAHVMLDTGGRLMGRVHRTDGTPWEGAQVLAVLVAMERPQPVMAYAYTYTDAQGRYELERLPEGYYVAMHQGDSPGALRTASNLTQTSVRRGVATVLDFIPRVGGSRLTGVLMDTDEKPLLGYTVYLNPDPLGSAFQNWIATPPRGGGRYQFEGVAPGSYDLYVAERPDRMIWLRRLQVTDTRDLEVDLVLPVGSVTGVVRTADGVATSALVMLMRWDAQWSDWAFHGKTDTGLDGDYDFVGLGPGRYRLSAIGLTLAAGSANPSPFELGEDAQQQNIALVAGGSLSVEVHGESGEPIPGAKVRLLDKSGLELAYHAEATTAADGLQRVPNLAAGTWTVTVTREGLEAYRGSVQVLVGEESSLQVTLRASSGR